MGKFLQFIILFILIGIFGGLTPLLGQNTIAPTIDSKFQPKKVIEIKAPSDREFQCTECINYIPCVNFESIQDPSNIKLIDKNIKISGGSPAKVETLAVFNSTSSVLEADLRTPNFNFGGLGQGSGGAPSSEGANVIPQNNILIIQDTSSSTPSSLDVKESFISFDFSEFNGVTISEIDLIDIDIEQTNARIELFDANKTLIGNVPVEATGNNGISTVSLSKYNNVHSIKVVLDGSGGIASICFGDQGIDFGTPDVHLTSHVHSTFKIDYTDEVIFNECGILKIIRTWYAYDPCGDVDTDTQVVTFWDTKAPVFVEELPQDLSVSCNEIPEPALLTATDNCDSDVKVVFEETRTEDPQCNTNITITRIWTATDCSGNTISHTQTIEVRDTDAPVFVEELPQDISISCTEIPEPIVLTATDNCDSDVEVVFEETRTEDLQCNINITITRIWTATDCSGNTISHTQTIEVRDTDAPIFVEELPQDLSVSCNEIPEPIILTATDNCDSDVAVVFEETRTEDLQCNINITITRKWTATDCSGNSISHTQTIEVRDTDAPIFVEELPQDISVSCTEIPEPIILTATDNCDSDVAVVFEETRTEDPQCNINVTITRIWTATDCSGNTVSHTQTIEVIDTDAPVFVEELPQDLSVSCNEIPEPIVLTATDNCDPDVEVVFEETREQTDSSCPFNNTITRIWTATDCSGNSISHTQTIEVRDTDAPIFVEELPQDLSVSCNEIPEPIVLTATDNCDPDVEVVFEETREAVEGTNDFLVIRTWTATDSCQNTSIHTQIISAIVENSTSVEIQICIEDDPINLLDLLPDGIDENGTFEVTSGDVTLDGSFFAPLGLPLTQYIISYITNPADGCPAAVEFLVTVNDDCVVLPCTENDVVISKVLTPNGDIYNEFFEITGIDGCGFVVDVIIFNRWGNKVFESNDYENNWDGSSRSGSGFVPSGTYYYVVTLRNSGIEPITGFIYVGTNSR